MISALISSRVGFRIRFAMRYIVIFMVVSIAGCGMDNRASVSGNVTLDGEPIESGVINFFPTGDNSGPTAGGVITNGSYEIKSARGVAIGSNQVVINSKQKTGRKIQSLDRVDEEQAEAIPPKYNDESILTHEIKPGDNEVDFALEGRIPIESQRRRYPGQ